MRALQLIILLCAGSCFPAAAQSLSQHVVSPAGDVDRNDRIVLAWTVGELAVSSRINQQESFTEGFHQPMLQVELMTDDVSAVNAATDATVFPNPVNQRLQVQFAAPVTTDWVITLTATDGAVLNRFAFKPGSDVASLDVSSLPAGIYYLQLRNTADQQLQYYKISKIQ